MTCNLGLAQDLSSIKDNKPITFHGGFSSSGTYYLTNEAESNRDPFIWMVNGNFNLSFYEVFNVPFSFFLSKENKKFDQPSYQQFGISPSYKAITLHAGYRNLNFSKYTLSGVTFLGGGIEISPEKSLFKLKAFYGRFARAQQFIPDNMFNPQAIFVMPSYERWGYGTMVTIGKKNHVFDLILFKASDEMASINIPDSLAVYPEENFVVGINARNKIVKNLFLDVNYALSALSTDIRQEEIHQETYSYSNNLGFLFTPRSSSQFNSVFDASINFKPGKVNLGMKYLRIDPEYKSLGTSFINNDVQEFTGNIASSFNKNKISVTGNVGVQNNNLDKKQLVTNKRLISALNFNWLINKNLSVITNLSNYNTNSTPVQIYLIDSIKYSQVTRNATFNINQNFGDSTLQHNLSGMFTFQNGKSLSQSGESVTDINNTFINSHISYRLNFIPEGLILIASLNYSNFISDLINTKSIGPSAGLSKVLLNKKINLGLNATYMYSFGESINETNILNFRFFANYKINKFNSLSLSINALSKKTDASSAFHSQASISYNLVF
jgi:hypothetical protein